MASENQIKNGILLIVGFMLVVLLGAQLLPQALNDWFNVSTTGWGSGAAALWPIIPLFMLIGVVLYFVAQAFDMI